MPIFSLTCFNLEGYHFTIEDGKIENSFGYVVLKFYKYLFNCDSSLIHDLLQAQAKQTVVKLEDSSRDKREEGRKSEGLPQG